MEQHQSPEGKLIVVTAPSGAGKTTIVRHLLDQFSQLAFSVSATSRKPRHYEVEGRDYYFLTSEEFKAKIDAGDFIEWEEVYENQFYGTLRSEVERLWEMGKHIIFDIDVKGALNISRIYPDRTLTIFVQPPGEEALLARLRNRKTETEATLRKRMDRVRKELSYADKFDRIVVNDVLETALVEAEKIVSAYLKDD